MMRTFSATLVIAAALVAAAPAHAQRMSLADRITVLEQRASNNQANVDLLRQVTMLTEEVQALRSKVEELSHQQEQFKQTSRAQYLDLDGRLNRLDGGTPAAALNADVPAAPAEAAASEPDRAPTATSADTAPAIYGDAGTLAQGAGERDAYDAAFAALKAGQYAESAGLFQSFLGNFPAGAYAPNALYWLGESYYVTQNYPLAETQFQALLDRYPTHDKAPGALLKVGLSQLGRKDIDAAERTLAEVAKRFPGTDAARVASDRLGALQLERLR